MDDYQVALLAAVLTAGPLSAEGDQDGQAQAHHDRVSEWAGDFFAMLRHLRMTDERGEL